MTKWVSALVALAIVVSGAAFWLLGGNSEVSTATTASTSEVLSEDQVAMQRELLASVPAEEVPSIEVQSTSAGDVQLVAWTSCTPQTALFTTRQWQVAAFFLGYCPSEWALRNTAWGKAVVNYVVNGLCKQPLVVRAATFGKYSTC